MPQDAANNERNEKLRQKELPFPNTRDEQLKVLRHCKFGNSTAKHLLRVIDDHIGIDNETWCLKIEDLADEMDCSEDTIYRHMNFLEDLYLIETSDLGGRRYEFRISWPNVMDYLPDGPKRPKNSRRGRKRRSREDRKKQEDEFPQNAEDSPQSAENPPQIAEDSPQSAENPPQIATRTSCKRPKSAQSAQEEVCPEQAPGRPSSEATEFVFDCVGTGPRSWTLSRSKLEEYLESYPGLDVRAEILKARQWIRDNPTKRKTAGGMPAFLTRWLNRSQNSKGSANDCTPQRKAGYAKDSVYEAFGPSDDP